jgi:hypothetical protein
MAITEAYGKNDNGVPHGANSGGRTECIRGGLWRGQLRTIQTVCGNDRCDSNTNRTNDTVDAYDTNHATDGRAGSDQRK